MRDKKVLINQYYSPNAMPFFSEPLQYGKKKHAEVKKGEDTIKQRWLYWAVGFYLGIFFRNMSVKLTSLAERHLVFYK